MSAEMPTEQQLETWESVPRLAHPPSIQVEGDALLIAVQQLMQVSMGKEDAPLQKGVSWLARHALKSVSTSIPTDKSSVNDVSAITEAVAELTK